MKSLFFSLVFIAVLGDQVLAQNISIENKTGKSKSTYLFIKKNTCKIAFTDKRPDKNDATVLVCIPAAFTNLQNLKIDGLYAVNGLIGNTTAINKTLGGVFYIEKNNVKVFQSARGKLFNDSLLTIIKANKASCFQQIQCIQNGKAASFKDQKIFQRRGIAILKDNSIAIIESAEPITLKTFSEDLALLGVKQLIYTDMGAWDEGWYKEPAAGKIVRIGKDLSQTAKQSNWVIFKK
ncbi:MAG: hypothetical protein V4677_08285 [Bacteroidota bacterium]